MKRRLLVLAVCFGSLRIVNFVMNAQERPTKLVRIAEIEVDAAQLEAYKAELRREIDASMRLEPGVLALYAVAVKDRPNQIRLFEIYSGDKAYQAHLQSPHFRKYKAATAGMVKSLTLIETDPVELENR